MATRSAKLYQGEDKLPVVDYTDSVIWEESEFGTRAHNGEGSASNVVIRDPLGEQGSAVGLPSGLSMKTLPSKSLFLIEVDTSLLFRGRVGIKNYTRDGQHVERYRQVDVSLHDTHWDLDHIFVHGYSRGAETDIARVQGIIASYLSGNGRPTTVLNGSNYISASNPVTLPAQTYNRTSPLGMLREIAISANKQFFETADTIGGGSLFWDGNDSTAYACPFTISDRATEVAANPGTYFPPIWNVGPASSEDGSEQIDEVRYFYGSGDDSYVTAHSDIVHTQYGHASVTIYDDTAATAAEATVRAESILSHRRREDRTYNVSIGPLTDAQVVQIKHGMTIPIKARAIPDADDAFQVMRIGQCRYTTPVPGAWFAHLQLGRPWKTQPYSLGNEALTTKPDLCHDTPETFAGGIDDFARTEATGWGTGPLGEWVYEGGDADASVSGGIAVYDNIDELDDIWQYVDVSGNPQDFLFKVRGYVTTPGVTSGALTFYLTGGNLAGANRFEVGINPEADGTFHLRTVSSEGVLLHEVKDGAGFFGEWFNVRATYDGDNIRARMWWDEEDEPDVWHIETTATNPGDISRIYARGFTLNPTSTWRFEVEFLQAGIITPATTCIHGGPGASSSDDTDAAPAGHAHDYVAAGGTTGQHLAKASAADFDTQWVTPDHSTLGGLTTGDPHTQYQKESEKGAANGYASLGSDTLVPQDQLGSGAQDGTKFLRDDGTWQNIPGAGSTVIVEEVDGSPTVAADTIKFPNGSVTDNGDGSVSVSTGSTGGVTVEDEGTPLATTATTLDFVGAGVTATGSGAEKTITIPGAAGAAVGSASSVVSDECFFVATSDIYEGGVSRFVTGTGANSSAGTVEAGHPGVIQMSTGAQSTGRCTLAQSGNRILLGGGQVSFNIVFRVHTLSDGTETYTVFLGLSNSSNPSVGVYFRYSHGVNSGKWEAVCEEGGTETAADTGVTADTNWHRFGAVVNAGATSVEFFIDGASVATINTDIPTSECALYPAHIGKSVGTTARLASLDAYWYEFEFTTPR